MFDDRMIGSPQHEGHFFGRETLMEQHADFTLGDGKRGIMLRELLQKVPINELKFVG